MVVEAVSGGQNAVAAFLVGVGWATIVGLYERIWDGRTGSASSTSRIIPDALFIGGGTGVFLYLTDSFLSSWVHGMAGFLLVAIAVTAGKILFR